MHRKAILLAVFALVLTSGCGKNTGGTSPAPEGGGPTVTPTPAPQPPAPRPNEEKFEILDSAFKDTSGWTVESAERGRQSVSPTAAGLELSVQRPFEGGEAPQCLGSSVVLRRNGILKDLTDGTVELQFAVQELPKNVEYALNLEAGIAPGTRLFSFTQQGIRTYTPEASVTVSPTQLTPGNHTARLVAKGEAVWLYYDGKKVGEQARGYLKGREPGDLVLRFLAIEKFPARSAEDCGNAPAKVLLKKIRVASQAFTQ